MCHSKQHHLMVSCSWHFNQRPLLNSEMIGNKKKTQKDHFTAKEKVGQLDLQRNARNSESQSEKQDMKQVGVKCGEEMLTFKLVS
jgi:hypothetical protein